MVSTSLTGLTTLVVNAQDDAGVTKPGKGIPTRVDDSELRAAIAEAKKMGLTVDEKTKELVVDAKDTTTESDKIKADYSVQAKAIKEAVATYKAAKEKYDTEKAQYDKDYAQYEKDLKKYNDNVAGQLDDANPKNPLQPDYLANEQPYKLDENRNSLSKVSGDVSGKITDPSKMPAGTLYNSDNAKIVTIKDASKPITVTWKNVGKDTKSKKSLDVTVQYSNFALTNVDTFPQGNGSYLAVYSNYVDNVSLMNIDSVDQKVTFSYSDSGKAYDKNYYLTSGSQNYGLGAAEFSFPVDKVKATYLNKTTYIRPELQDVYGPAKNKHSQGFRGKDNTDQPEGISDNSPEALTKLGVSYFVSNGATIAVGISGINGNDPHNTNAYSAYDHLMISDNTVADTIIKPVAPVKPKAPGKPKLFANLTNLLSMPNVNKDVETGNVEGNPEGSANKQVFMKGDKMTYALSTSALPAGREKLKSLGFSDTLPKGFKYDEFKAFDKSGKDVTDQIKDVKVKDGVITGSYTGFNDDLNKPFDVPTIDLYGTANADNVKLENKFELLVDGDPYESNKVENPTDNTNVKKDVQLGNTTGLDGTSIDGKTVVKGQELTYALKGKDLAANRAADITSMEWTDTLPENVDFKEFKVFDGTTGEDITEQFKNTGKDKDIHIVAQPEAIKNANADKKNAYKVPVVKFYVVANEDGVAFENTAKFKVNENEVESNTVKNQTPEFNPVKHDLDEHGNDIDGHDVKPGSTINYNIDWDMTGMKDVAISQEMMDKGISISDDYDETKLDVDDDVKNNVSIELKDDEDKATDDEKNKPSVDETIDNSDDDKAIESEKKAKSETDQDTAKDPDVEQPEDGLIVGEGTADKFDMNDVNVAWDDKMGKLVVSARDTREFLKKYAGKVLVIKFSPRVKADATGTVDNIATQNTFGNDKDTNKVSNNITPDAKPVEKELSHTGSTSFISRVIDSIKNILTK